MSKRILVVDDDPVIRSLLSDIASSFGHRVEAFENGEACLTKLITELPDVIILDMQMPGMNGLEVLRRLKADQRTAAVPVIMLSANSDSAELSSDQAQADRYVQKPFNVGEFMAALDKTGQDS